MAACPVGIAPTPNPRRRPIGLTQRRLEANRRNAAHSTGPRTSEGKARVARNAVKHGFFVTQDKWTPQQDRDFEATLEGLRDDLKPDGMLEEHCVQTIAQSYVRMASVLRYENIAALKHHQERDRELDERIVAADASEAARLRAQRAKLRRAGLWRPTIPGPREARAIIRYSGSLDRAIRQATSRLESLKNLRIGGLSSTTKVQKQTHFSAAPSNGAEVAAGSRRSLSILRELQNQTHFAAVASEDLRLGEGPQEALRLIGVSEQTNPLSSMFTGNRHQRRRAKTLAARRK